VAFAKFKLFDIIAKTYVQNLKINQAILLFDFLSGGGLK